MAVELLPESQWKRAGGGGKLAGGGAASAQEGGGEGAEEVDEGEEGREGELPGVFQVSLGPCLVLARLCADRCLCVQGWCMWFEGGQWMPLAQQEGADVVDN